MSVRPSIPAGCVDGDHQVYRLRMISTNLYMESFKISTSVPITQPYTDAQKESMAWYTARGKMVSRMADLFESLNK